MPDLMTSATQIVKRLSYDDLESLAVLFEQPKGAEIFADAINEWLKKIQELPQPGINMTEDQRAQWEALQAEYQEKGRVPRRKKKTA
jgi:hypothetical protein